MTSHRHLRGGVLALLGTSALWMVPLLGRSAPVCTINGTVESCDARLVGDALTVTRADGSQIQSKRLGRCGEKRDADGLTRRCNVRISLPDDFVYGLQIVQPTDMVQLIAPILTIEVEGLSRSED